MPVILKLSKQEIRQAKAARSENISLRGILLSSESLIPEGSAVEVAVGVATLPDHAIHLSATGKVLRVMRQSAGNFSVAIEFDRPFVLGLQTPNTRVAEEHSRVANAKTHIVPDRGLTRGLAWYTET